MAAFVNTSRMILLGTAWSSVAPGIPGTQTIAGTITSPKDISGFVKSGHPSTKAAMQDTTTFGSGGYSAVIPGLKSGDDITFECLSDFAASQINSIVNTDLGGVNSGTLVYVDIKPTNAARSATNPSFVAAGYITAWTGGGGSVGDVAMAQLTISITGKFGDLVA